MKRIVSLLVLVLFLNACDDGDLTLETIDFNEVSTQSCSTNEILYKLKEKEALLLQIPLSSFTNTITTDSPKSIDIDNSNYRVVYRFYNGTVATENICSIIPPANPIVNDQWSATSGKIQITTTAVKSSNTTNNSTRITGYNHSIIFKNITFAKNNGTQVYETFAFGDYVTSATTLPFGFDKTVEQCSTSKQVYDNSSGETFTLDDLDSALISNTETPLNTPRTASVSLTKNKIAYRLFTGLITPSYFCNSTTPTTPAISEEWNAISGTIEVTTIKNGISAYKHTIIFKNVILKKGNLDFKLGDTYTYGELITTI